MKISNDCIEKMAAVGRQRVIEEYSVEKMTMKTMEIYGEEQLLLKSDHVAQSHILIKKNNKGWAVFNS